MNSERTESDSTQAKALEALKEATQSNFTSRFILAEGIEDYPIPIFVVDLEHRIAVWNKALARLTGQTEKSMVGSSSHWQAFYARERPTLADLIIDGALEQDVDRYYHGKYNRSELLDGGIEVYDFFPDIGEDGRWLYFTAAPLKDPSGQVVGAIEVLQDVTTRHQAEAALRQSQGFLKQIVDGSSVPTLVINREHRLTHWNRACEVITGVSAVDLVGTRDQWRPFYPSERPIMADLILDNALDNEVAQFYRDKFRPSTLIAGAFEAEDFFPHLGERGKWLFFTAAPLSDVDGKFIGAIETLQDVTDKKFAEQALRDSETKFKAMSITDALTSLFNARHFYERGAGEIERASRFERPLALLLLDLDDFKKVNDTYGHLEGDKALVTTATVIRSVLRAVDTAFRYGGEEFIVLLPESDIESATVVAERLRQSLASTPLTTAAGVSLHITASIGVSEYCAPEAIQDLVRRADAGVYEAKRQGKDRVIANRLSSGVADPVGGGD